MLKRAHHVIAVPLAAIMVMSLMSFYETRKVFARDCPIVLDLNGDGRISTTTTTSSKGKSYSLRSLLDFVSFDIDGDELKDRIEWISGTGYGILVDEAMIPTSLQIDGHALFGNIGFGDGFESLAARDADANGVLEGKELDGLKLWQDNGDAVLQKDELHSLSDFHVSTVPVVGGESQSEDGSYHLTANATTDDGRPLLIEDVWFLNVENLSTFEQAFEYLATKLV